MNPGHVTRERRPSDPADGNAVGRGSSDTGSDMLALSSMLALAANESMLALPLTGASDGRNVASSSFRSLDQLLRLMPDQVELMTSLLHVLNATTAKDEPARAQALLLIQECVEDLDKAHDFRRSLDGFRAVVAILKDPTETTRLHELAAWAVGTAAQNQRDLQLHILEMNALPSLLQLVRDDRAPTTRAKALFAVSALLRNCPEGQWAFDVHDGMAALLEAIESAQPRLVRKALVLVADLIHETLAAEAAAAAGRPTYDGHLHNTRPPPLWHRAHFRGEQMCRAVLRCLRLNDVDSQEKAVTALKYLYAAGLIAAPDASTNASTTASTNPSTTAAHGGEQHVESADECRRRGVPNELTRLLRLCGDSGTTFLPSEEGGSDLNCEELRPMLQELRQQLSDGLAPAVRVRESDTVFHIEVV